MDIDDFYLNLMASGNELGNLPGLASPNRTLADAQARRANELQYESPDQRAARLAQQEATRAVREKMRARQQTLLDSIRRNEPSSTQQLSEADKASAIDGPEQAVEQQDEQVIVGVASSQERTVHARRLRMNSAGMIEEDTSAPTGQTPQAESNVGASPLDSTPEAAVPSSSSSSPSLSGPSSPSFAERYPNAARLSGSSFPSPRSSYSSSTPSSSAPAGATDGPGPVDPISDPSRPSASVTDAAASSPTVDQPTPSSTASSSPPATFGLARQTRPRAFNPSGMNLSKPRSSHAVRPIRPPTNALINQLEAAIVKAEASRASSPSTSSSYLELPPSLDLGPPSPIQPVGPTDSQGGPRPPRSYPTAFPPAAGAAPAGAVYNRDGKVKLAAPLAADAPKRAPKPTVLPLGLMTHGEWKAVVYRSLDEPARRKAAREHNLDRKAAAQGRTVERERAKLKDKLRRARNEHEGKLVRTGTEKVEAMQQAGYALQAAEVLDLMVRSGDQPALGWYLDVLRSLADAGDVQGVQQVITQSERSGIPANYKTYSHLVDAHLSLNDKHGAVATLHDLENRDLYPIEATYRKLIRTLVQSDIHSERAVGWDLVAHMRLVAHPIPSKETYDLLMDACANVILPEPERALDLWTEMTIDNGVQPDVRSFNAIIKAVGSTRKFYLEAFRLMRQMLDFYHTAIPDSPQRAMYTPNRETFESLLVGAKKNGDIARTRWILTEMIRFSNHPGLAENGADIAPTAHTMKSVFQAYSSARPNIRRTMLKEQGQIAVPADHPRAVTDGQDDPHLVEEGEEEDEDEEFDPSQVTVEYGEAAETMDEHEMDDDAEWGTMDPHSFEHHLSHGHTEQDPSASSSHPSSSSSSEQQDRQPESPSSSGTSARGPNVQQTPLPQSSSEIIDEAGRLLAHASDDSKIYYHDRTQRTPAGNLPSLRHVLVDTSLVNAYIHVIYRHTDEVKVWLHAFDTVYAEQGVRKDARSYLALFEALQAPRRHKPGLDRDEAANGLYRVFQEWELWEKETGADLQARLDRGKDEGEVWAIRRAIGLEPRVVEKIWASAIKVMALAGQLSIAMSMTNRFFQIYPPEDILKSNLAPLPSKALIRMVPRSSIRPDPLPPHLLFPDLQSLHQALALLQQEASIGRIKWICMRYAECISQARRHKLDEGRDGEMRKAENALDINLRKINKDHRKKSGDYARAEGKKAGAGLARFEGGFGLLPDDVPIGQVERKIFRIHGKEALDKYVRAKRQF